MEASHLLSQTPAFIQPISSHKLNSNSIATRHISALKYKLCSAPRGTYAARVVLSTSEHKKQRFKQCYTKSEDGFLLGEGISKLAEKRTPFKEVGKGPNWFTGKARPNDNLINLDNLRKLRRKNGFVSKNDLEMAIRGGFNPNSLLNGNWKKSDAQPGLIKNIRQIEDNYELLSEMGWGNYGVVSRMRDKKTGKVMAVKKMSKISLSTLSEIYIQDFLPRHPSIIELKQAMRDDLGYFFVAMECIDNDLDKFLKLQKQRLTEEEIKSIMKKVLEGVHHLHQHSIMHRDLKPSNILINNRHQIKICDFGMSRHELSESGPYSPGVVTRLYRAPELLKKGKVSYSRAIDMWSVGCIMAEIVFRGNSETHQPICIDRNLMANSDLLWKKLGAAVLTESGYDLLVRLLDRDQYTRITVEDAINHKWFKECWGLSDN